MPRYRLYYCDRNGKRFATHDFEATDDDSSLGRARAIARLKSPLFELWEGQRLVYRENAALRRLGDSHSPHGMRHRGNND